MRNAYWQGQKEVELGLLSGLMSSDYISGRVDARREDPSPSKTRPGHTWVDDKRVKGGGYWRKLPNSGRGFSTKLAATAAVGVGAALLAARQSKAKPAPTTSLSAQPREIIKTVSVTNKGAIAAAVGIGAIGGVSGAVVALQGQRKQIIDNAKAEAEAEIARSRQESEEKIQQIVNVRSSREETYQKDLQAKQAELDKVNKAFIQITQEAESTRIKSVEIESSLRQEKERRSALEQELTTINAVAQKAQAREKQLIKQLETTAVGVSEKDKGLLQLQTKHSQLKQEYEKKQGRVQELESQVQQSDRRRVELESSLATTKAESDTLKGTEAQTRTELETIRSSFANAQQDLGNVRRLATEKEQQLSSARQEIDKLNYTKRQTESELERVKENLSSSQKDLEVERTRLSESEQRISELNSKVEQLSQERDELLVKKTQIEANYNQQQEVLEGKNAREKELTTQIEESDRQQQSLLQEKAQLVERVKNLEQQSQEYQSERDTAQKRVSELESEAESKVKAEVDKIRVPLEGERDAAIAETNAAKKVVKQLEAKQRDLEEAVDAAKDPSPIAGKQKKRGDLLQQPDGSVALGASVRWGSEFLSYPPESQAKKLITASDNMVEASYGDAIKGLSQNFRDSIQAIDKVPSPVHELGGEKLNNPVNLSRAINFAEKNLADLKQQYQGRPDRSGKLAQLEQAIVLQRLREESLESRKKQLIEEARNQHLEILDAFHQRFQSEFEDFDPSKVTPEALQVFDKAAKRIQEDIRKSFTDALAKSLDPSFLVRLQNSIENAPDLDATKLLEQQVKQQSNKRLGSRRRQDSSVPVGDGASLVAQFHRRYLNA